MSTRIFKGLRGWTAETTIPLNETHSLRFATFKRSNGGICTTATRVKLEDGGFSFVLFQDFNTRVLSEAGRATEKAVADQHQRALAQLDSIKAACAAHYMKEVA